MTSDTLSSCPPDEMSAVAACFNEIRLYICAHTRTHTQCCVLTLLMSFSGYVCIYDILLDNPSYSVASS